MWVFDKTVVWTVAYAWTSGNNKDLGKPGIRKVSDVETKESVWACLDTKWRDLYLTVSSDTGSAPDLGLGHSARQGIENADSRFEVRSSEISGPPIPRRNSSSPRLIKSTPYCLRPIRLSCNCSPPRGHRATQHSSVPPGASNALLSRHLEELPRAIPFLFLLTHPHHENNHACLPHSRHTK